MKYIDKKNALKICYFMMAADGLISDTERSKFDELGYLLDDAVYDTYKSDLLWECKQQALTVTEGDPTFHLMNAIDRELKGVVDIQTDRTIQGRLQVWNMLTIALCDRGYADSERRLIEEAVRKLEVDVKDFREMEHTLIAANAVAMEESLIRERETGNEDVKLQLKNLKERERVISAHAREQVTGRK